MVYRTVGADDPRTIRWSVEERSAILGDEVSVYLDEARIAKVQYRRRRGGQCIDTTGSFLTREMLLILWRCRDSSDTIFSGS